MMNVNLTHRDMDDLKTKIHSFRVSDLQSLVASFGRSRNGKKQDLQNRALEILRTQPQDVDILAFKRKIYELYRVAQDEAKQTHYDFQVQQQQRSMSQPGNAYMTPGQYPLPPQSRPAGNTIIYQNGGIVSGNGYPNAPVYPGPVHLPSIQPPSSISSNLGSTVRIINPPISHTNIQFKMLPFYRVRHEILKPTMLKLKTNGRNNATQLFQVSFVLTCDIASDIAMHRDFSKNEYSVQAQLRICAIDNSNNQIIENDDLLPLGLFVRMNDKQCPLPPPSPSTRPNVESRRIPLPINVTHNLKLSPMNVNKLTINWTPEVGRTFVACVNVVEKLTSNYLLDKLRSKPTISVDITKEIIARQYKRVIDDDDENEDADDDDIATTIVRVSLQCPLAKFRMMYPAKGRNCGHLQCFDGFAYISCNEKKSVWMCPVCNRSLHYDDLFIDQYFVDVLASEDSSSCQEVQLFVDGSWKVYEEENVPDANDKPKPKNSASDSSEENLSSSGSERFTNQERDQKHVVSDNAVSTSGISASIPDSFVDLTEDDDEMMDAESEVQTAVDERPEELPANTDAEDVLASNLPSNDSNYGAEKIASPFSVANQATSALTTPRVSPSSSPSLQDTTQAISVSSSPSRETTQAISTSSSPSRDTTQPISISSSPSRDSTQPVSISSSTPPHDTTQPTSPVSPAISLRIHTSPSPSEHTEDESDSYATPENADNTIHSSQNSPDSSQNSSSSSPNKPLNPMVMSPSPSPPTNPMVLSPRLSPTTNPMVLSPRPSSNRNSMVLSPSPSPTNELDEDASRSPFSRSDANKMDEDAAVADEGANADVEMNETVAANSELPEGRDSIRYPNTDSTKPSSPTSNLDSDEDMPMEGETSVPHEDASAFSSLEKERTISERVCDTDERSVPSTVSEEKARSPVRSEMANLNIGN